MHIKLNAVNLNYSDSFTTNFRLIFVRDSRGWWLSPAWLVSAWSSALLHGRVIKSIQKELVPRKFNLHHAVWDPRKKFKRFLGKIILFSVIRIPNSLNPSPTPCEDLFPMYNIKIRDK